MEFAVYLVLEVSEMYIGSLLFLTVQFLLDNKGHCYSISMAIENEITLYWSYGAYEVCFMVILFLFCVNF